MTLKKLGGGELSRREIVELAVNNALPNIDDLPARSEYEITQNQVESELADIAETKRDIRAVMRARPTAISVSESQTAMDVVASSQTGMDAVSASTSSRSFILGSPSTLEDIWKRDVASQAILEAFSPTPPHNYSGSDVNSSIINNQYSSGKALEIDVNNETDSEEHEAAVSIDFSDYSTMTLQTWFTNSSGYTDMLIFIGSDRVFKTSSDHGWTERSFNVLGRNGMNDISFVMRESGGSRGQSGTGRLSAIQLSRK